MDIGGTFTDAILIDVTDGSMLRSKVPTTPRDPAAGFMSSVRRITKEVDPSEVSQIVHATTIATNAIIEGKVSSGALLTTKGFRDILEIQRQIRPKLYDVFFDKPRPLVPRYNCFEVSERITAEGDVLVPLDQEETERVARQIRKEGVESVAICFLHSYVNPSHEKKAAEIIAEACPDVYLSVSHEVSPQFREYFRASTAVVNAVIMPMMAKYLARLEADLLGDGFKVELYIMQSSGGLMRSDVTKRKPVYVVESGPAAGTIATGYVAGLMGFRNAISFDMGGTTAKVGLVEAGSPKVASNYEVGAMASAELGGLTKGSGYPLRTPVMDLVEIGAGGGSIAWVDSGGALRVGPQSAGADPGPACYPNGGREPTVTDANLLLGRLGPNNFLGGEMKLSLEKARRAVQERCATPVGGDVLEAANGVVEIANANMLRALRLASVERGYDPRDFVIVAFGGAGPMHANALAKELGIPTIVVPPNPGLFSALGLLVTDLKHDYVRTYIADLDALDRDRVESIYSQLESEAISTLLREGMDSSKITLNRSMDMRYVGQSYELPIAVPRENISAREIEATRAKFHQAHERAYGHSAREEPVEVVNLKLTAVGTIPKPSLVEVPKGNHDPSRAVTGKRRVYFPGVSSVDCDVYDRRRLMDGDALAGPAIVEEVDSTTVVYPGYHARVKRWGLLFITKQGGPR